MATADSDFVLPSEISADRAAPGMDARPLDDRAWVIVFSAGDEVLSGLTQWARSHGVEAGHFTAVGAWRRALLGYYDLSRKAYRKIVVDQQVELLSLVGDFAEDPQGRVVVHAHAVVGLPDGATRGGHLLEAYVSPTTEVFVTTAPSALKKRFDPASGLALIVPRER